MMVFTDFSHIHTINLYVDVYEEFKFDDSYNDYDSIIWLQENTS